MQQLDPVVMAAIQAAQQDPSGIPGGPGGVVPPSGGPVPPGVLPPDPAMMGMPGGVPAPAGIPGMPSTDPTLLMQAMQADQARLGEAQAQAAQTVAAQLGLVQRDPFEGFAGNGAPFSGYAGPMPGGGGGLPVPGGVPGAAPDPALAGLEGPVPPGLL